MKPAKLFAFAFFLVMVSDEVAFGGTSGGSSTRFGVYVGAEDLKARE